MARQQAIPAQRDSDKIKQFRRAMVQVASEQINGNQILCTTHEIATMPTQTPMPSPPMHTFNTVSTGDAHKRFTELIDWTIRAVRTPPAGAAKAHYKKREGATKV